MAESFADIYAGNLWAGHETRSGPGSSEASTRELAVWLTALVHELGVLSVLDAGCGEGLWMPELPGYVGVDMVPSAIRRARRRRPGRTYGLADIRTDDLPHADLAFTRDTMQHLPVMDGLAVIDNLCRTGARFLVASTYTDGDNGADPLSPYHAYRVNLEVSPFDLGPPERSTCDGYDERGVLRDPTKLMGLWRW